MNGYRDSSPESFRSALGEVWLAPGRFFKNLDPDGGLIRPTLFATGVLYLNLLLETALQAIWVREASYSLLYAPLVGVVVSVVLAPLLLSMLTTLVLVVLDGGPSRARFAPVYRALGYSSGIGIIAWIPYGPFLALAYGAYVATTAIRETLSETWTKSALAVLVPLLALIFIIALLVGPATGYEILKNPAAS